VLGLLTTTLGLSIAWSAALPCSVASFLGNGIARELSKRLKKAEGICWTRAMCTLVVATPFTYLLFIGISLEAVYIAGLVSLSGVTSHLTLQTYRTTTYQISMQFALLASLMFQHYTEFDA
jgi:hypothetical protein